MYPEIFHLSFLHTYGVLVALAFLAGLWMAARLAKRAGLNAEAVTNLGIYCALAAIGGAKLMMFLVDLRYYAAASRRDFLHLATLQAGGVFYGGLIAALAVAWWYMRKTRLPLLKTADVFAPAIALGHGIGRLGCFSAGCCWGVRVPPALGGDVHQSGGQPPGGRAAGRSAASHAALRSLRGVRHFRHPLLAHRQAAPRPAPSSACT